MSRRNFILLIIVLAVAVGGLLLYFYFHRPAAPTAGGGEGTNFLDQFNPFGSTTPPPPATQTPPPVTIPPSGPDTETPQTANLKIVSSIPVAGYGIFKKERFKEVPVVTPPAAPAVATSTTTSQTGTSSTTATTTVVVNPKPTPPPTEFASALRYVARSSGNIYQTFADKLDERRFSSTVIPKVYEAYFSSNAESVVMRYLKPDDNTIETFVGNIPKEVLGADTTEDNQVTGTFLPENITDASISADKTKLFYLVEVGDGVIGTTSGLSDNKKAQVFDSAFTEWLSWWPNAKMITLTTKPSAFVPGYMYTVDPTTKKFTSIFGGINGLTTLASPDAKSVLYSGSDLSLNLYNIATKSSVSLGLNTLPEKCVWNKGSITVYCAVPKSAGTGLYPDDWYKGKVSFSDEIWKIDTTTGTTTMLVDPASVSGAGEIDGIKLGLDDEENYLFFVNKNDSYLWELGLK